MNNSIVTLNIAKYLCIDLRYLVSYFGQKNKHEMTLIWDDIALFTDQIKIKCNPLLVKSQFRHKHGYAFSRSLNSVRHLVDRQHFLESILKLRYYISEKHPIDLYNLPLASFN